MVARPGVKAPLKPRYYQLTAKRLFDEYAGEKGAVIVLPTGTGKTATAHLVLMDYVARGERVLWLAHRKELIDQPLATLREWWPHVRGGIVRAKRNECDKQVVYASKDTLLKTERLAQYLVHGPPALIIVDECHHAPSRSYKRLLQQLSATGAKVLGLTATPERSDSLELGDDWEIVYSMSILDAIDMGALVPPYAALDLIPDLDLSTVQTTAGDYNEGELEDALIKAHVVEHTVAAMRKRHLFKQLPFGDHKFAASVDASTLIFTVTVEQARLTARALRDDGWNAEAVWGTMRPSERDDLIGRFRRGEIQVLVNAGLLTEGTDLPIAEFEILARPTKSRGLYMQIVGRVLRLYEGKEYGHIIDLCGATKEHSIVSAAVIVDGVDCEKSPSGQHVYHQIDTSNEGRCEHCGKTVRCIRNLGPHEFRRGKCRHCGADQCPSSPDLGHHFIPWENARRKCCHCELEIPDPLATLAGREIQYREPVAWKRLDLPVELYACDLGQVGVMFMRRSGSLFVPYLFSRNKLTPLSLRPVDDRVARLLTDDVARRATRVRGSYGGKETTTAMRQACLRAEALARRLGLVEG